MGGNVAPILMAISGILDPKWAAVCLAGANALYALARGLAKHGMNPDTPTSAVKIETKK